SALFTLLVEAQAPHVDASDAYLLGARVGVEDAKNETVAGLGGLKRTEDEVAFERERRVARVPGLEVRSVVLPGSNQRCVPEVAAGGSTQSVCAGSCWSGRRTIANWLSARTTLASVSIGNRTRRR